MISPQKKGDSSMGQLEDKQVDLRHDFLEEYNADENILRYMKKTAGHGISYLLEHDYTDIYLDVVDKYIPKAKAGKGLRLLEFGCGAGMNLLHLVSVLERRGIAVDFACGADFSEGLIASAKVEAEEILTPQLMDKVRFCTGRNESLIDDMTKGLESSRESLEGSFDLIFGVNTIRYCHRLKNENDCGGAL